MIDYALVLLFFSYWCCYALNTALGEATNEFKV